MDPEIRVDHVPSANAPSPAHTERRILARASARPRMNSNAQSGQLWSPGGCRRRGTQLRPSIPIAAKRTHQGSRREHGIPARVSAGRRVRPAAPGDVHQPTVRSAQVELQSLITPEGPMVPDQREPTERHYRRLPASRHDGKTLRDRPRWRISPHQARPETNVGSRPMIFKVSRKDGSTLGDYSTSLYDYYW